MKFFNTAGPVNPVDHYCLQKRLNEPEIRLLIEQKKYFVLHAPRQSGKTTGIQELVKKINLEGKYTALYVNVEGAQASRSDFVKGMAAILEQFFTRIKEQHSEATHIIEYLEKLIHNKNFSGSSLNSMLNEWAKNSPKPLIIFIDEIDALVGDTLISVLRQLRSGYDQRPNGFPQSICLIGVRDVRDYRIWSDEQQASILGGSAFNIKAESLTLPDFTLEQVKNLYLQHTQETGQKFDDNAIEYAFYLTQGQPWLVNALAYQACFRDITNRKKSITKDIIEQAKETLIKRRDTHLDVLIDRLKEPRVRNIIQSMLLGTGLTEEISTDDMQYVMDLGIVAKDGKDLKISNPIYQEILPSELVCVTQGGLTEQTSWYQNPDGSLDINKLLEAFAQFFRENSEMWLEKFDYKEAGPHLLLMAFLQRIINGGGKLHREYALGRKRMDLRIDWFLLRPSSVQEQFGHSSQHQIIVIELKLLYGPKTLPDGLAQTAEYMDTCKASQGHLVIFDRSKDKSWDEKIYHKQETFAGKVINVWGM